MDCGVAGIYLKKPLQEYPEGGAARSMYSMLIALQHRGQESAGCASFNPYRETSKLDVYKGIGLVREVFRGSLRKSFHDVMKTYSGIAAIGHVRYSTSGSSNGDYRELHEEIQPFHRRHTHTRKHFAFAWNGNLANHKELREEVESTGEYKFDTKVDTEVLMHFLANGIKRELEENKEFSLERMLRTTTAVFDGSYSVVMLDRRGTLTAFRDPKGFMPLCWGENKEVVAVASETKALNKIGIYLHQDVLPGEYLIIEQGKEVRKGRFGEAIPTPCFFQWMYFANPMSKMDGVKVKKFRQCVAEELADLIKEDIREEWIIVPVPQTSVPIAQKIAQILELEYVDDALIKDQDIRAFIEKQEQRDNLLGTKYTLDPDELRGKNIYLIDDSIIRGDTTKRVTTLIKRGIEEIRREAKPSKIRVLSANPPTISPCFYGVDFPTRNELIANRYQRHELEEKLANALDVDKVRYLPIERLYRIFKKLNIENYCDACITANYPTPAGQKRLEELLPK